MSEADDVDPKIGLALSGGGARAIAFHLGCLRALDGHGIVGKVRILSTVSGGSVIGAMYSLHEGSFAEFEAKVRALLKQGLFWPSLRTALTTTEGSKASASFLLLAMTNCVVGPLLWLANKAARLVGSQGQSSGEAGSWLPRRFASRTTILQRTMDRLVFHGRTLGSLPATGPRWTGIAAELRTGSAFYFGRRAAGSWRLGRIDPGTLPLAQAVVASAAYPLFLPALDETFAFDRRDGSVRSERVTLTDGGVYDNLGLAPLWPDRDPSISVGVEEIDTIIACRAGYGLRTTSPSMFMPSRMSSAFGTLHARSQNASIQRLFDLKVAGRIRDFAVAYLDQDDGRLKCAPQDLVSRISVDGYPTDFSAMPEAWIERLSKRGEQLITAVLQEHLPDLLVSSRNASDD